MAAPDPEYQGLRLPPLAELARRQGGVVGREQLRALGVGAGAIEYRMRAGELHRVHRAVYAVGHRALTPHGRLHAALLAAGPDAVLSHRTAAALWDLARTARARVEVTTTRRGRKSTPQVEIHAVRSLPLEERTLHLGLRATTVARTLLDLADVLPESALHHALEESLRRRRFDRRAVDAALANAHGRRGATRLRHALEVLEDAPPLTRSRLERAFARFCRVHRLPPPSLNAPLLGHEVDALWPAARLVVELDGFGIHHTPQAFERDRERDRQLTAAGYRVIRLTARQLDTNATAVAADLAATLLTPS